MEEKKKTIAVQLAVNKVFDSPEFVCLSDFRNLWLNYGHGTCTIFSCVLLFFNLENVFNTKTKYNIIIRRCPFVVYVFRLRKVFDFEIVLFIFNCIVTGFGAREMKH